MLEKQIARILYNFVNVHKTHFLSMQLIILYLIQESYPSMKKEEGIQPMGNLYTTYCYSSIESLFCKYMILEGNKLRLATIFLQIK